MALMGFVVWLGLLAAAGLCFPRRPHVTGVLFILLGVWSSVLRFGANGGARPLPWLSVLAAGGIWLGIGISHLVRYRDPLARAAHVRTWTVQRG